MREVIVTVSKIRQLLKIDTSCPTEDIGLRIIIDSFPTSISYPAEWEKPPIAE